MLRVLLLSTPGSVCSSPSIGTAVDLGILQQSFRAASSSFTRFPTTERPLLALALDFEFRPLMLHSRP